VAEISIPKVWRSELRLIILFFITSILAIYLSFLFPWTIIVGKLFTISAVDVSLHLPILWFIPMMFLSVAIFKVHDVKYAIDEDGLEAHVGILNIRKRTVRVRFEDIRSVQTHQAIMDRLLDIGNIEIRTAATSDLEIVLGGVSAPLEIHSMIESEKERRQQLNSRGFEKDRSAKASSPKVHAKKSVLLFLIALSTSINILQAQPVEGVEVVEAEPEARKNLRNEIMSASISLDEDTLKTETELKNKNETLRTKEAELLESTEYEETEPAAEQPITSKKTTKSFPDDESMEMKLDEEIPPKVPVKKVAPKPTARPTATVELDTYEDFEYEDEEEPAAPTLQPRPTPTRRPTATRPAPAIRPTIIRPTVAIVITRPLPSSLRDRSTSSHTSLRRSPSATTNTAPIINAPSAEKANLPSLKQDDALLAKVQRLTSENQRLTDELAKVREKTKKELAQVDNLQVKLMVAETQVERLNQMIEKQSKTANSFQVSSDKISPEAIKTLYATVLGDSISPRTGPGTDYSPISSLSRGDKVPVEGRQGHWIRVRLTSGALAWVHSGLVRLETEKPQSAPPPKLKASENPAKPQAVPVNKKVAAPPVKNHEPRLEDVDREAFSLLEQLKKERNGK
jgi:membrane protein YdbS with pleckstrin-like domain/uncharacterized protein YraI